MTKSKTSVWTCVYSLHLLFFSQHLHDWMVSEVEHERERAINTWFKLLQYFTEVMDPSVSIGVGSGGGRGDNRVRAVRQWGGGGCKIMGG